MTSPTASSYSDLSPDQRLRRFRQAISNECGGSFSNGNTLRVVSGPAFFDALIHDITHAKGSVIGNIFGWGKNTDALTRDVTKALIYAAYVSRVPIGLVMDSAGAFKADPTLLIKAGVHLRRFHPLTASHVLRKWKPVSAMTDPERRMAKYLAKSHQRVALDESLVSGHSPDERFFAGAVGWLKQLAAFSRSHRKGWAFRDIDGVAIRAWEHSGNFKERYRDGTIRNGKRIPPNFDVAMSIEGPGGYDREALIVQTWAAGVPLSDRSTAEQDLPWMQRPVHAQSPRVCHEWDGGIQCVQSYGLLTPASRRPAGLVTLIEMIGAAATQVTIVTPYLELPIDALRAIQERKAADSNFRVVIATNGAGNDEELARVVGLRQYRELLNAGIELQEYRGPGMFHWKYVEIDTGAVRGTPTRICRIGSSNVNQRSMEDSETDTIVYDEATCNTLHEIATQDIFANCEPVTLERLSTMHIPARLPNPILEIGTNFT